MGQRLIITVIGEPNPEDKADLELKKTRRDVPGSGEDRSVLLNCYYHWGAYTNTAADLSLNVMREMRRLALAHGLGAESTITQQLAITLMSLLNTRATFPTDEEKQNTIDLLAHLKGIASDSIDDADLRISQMHQTDIALLDEVINLLAADFIGNRNDGLIGCSNSMINDNAGWSEGDSCIDASDLSDPSCDFGLIWEISPEDLDDEDLEDLRYAVRLPVDPTSDYLNVEAMEKFINVLGNFNFYKFLYLNGTTYYQTITG